MFTLEALADEITTLAAHIHAATCRWLELIAEFDRREGWGHEGCASCAQWVSWKCAIAPGAAREHVRVARRLGDLPAVRAAFARGELSYSKVRALTRIDQAQDELELVSLARHATAAQLERIVQATRRVIAVEEGTERAHRQRSLTWSYDDDGALVLRGRLPAEQGALLVCALEAARDRLGPPAPTAASDVPAGTSPEGETIGARNVDALLALAETALGEQPAGRSADRYQVVVHVDAAVLAGADAGGEQAAGRCELAAGVPLPAEAVRRLACDGSLVRIVEQDGWPLSVGRRTRSVPPALRRALQSRDGGCRFPGCTSTRRVDAHHIEHWAAGGRTDLGNLVALCRRHHRLLHEGGFGVRRQGTELAFYTPQGERLHASPRPVRGDRIELLRQHARRRIAVSAQTCVPLSYDRLDLGYAVDAMLAITGRRE